MASANNETQSSTPSPLPRYQPFLFPQTISEKLTSKNYLFWCSQVEPVIKGHKLHHFLLNPQIPQKYASVADRDADRVSDEYADWEARDQLLLSWLHSTISKEILPRIIGCKSSWELWDKIHNYFVTLANVKVR